MESEEGNEKTRKKNGKCDRQHRSSLCDDRRNRISGCSIPEHRRTVRKIV